MSDGWIKLHRKSLESRVFSDAALWRLWTWCLLKANHAPGFFCGEEILPGSFATGTRVAGDALGLSPSTVHRGLKRLAEWSMVELKVKRGYTVVTICNYATYQDSNQPSETLVKQTCNADETLMKPNKNNNNNKNLPPSPPPATQGGDSPRSAAWKGVEEDLRKAGVRLAPDAVAHARSAGCSPDDVTDVICYWRLHVGAWDAGALYQRVKNLAPGQDCSELWPDKLPTYQAAKRREETAKSHASVVSSRIDAEKKKAADEKRLAALEKKFGQKIDGMTDEQVRASIEKAEPGSVGRFLLKRYSGGRPIGTIRETLLNYFSEVPQGPTLVLEPL